MDETLEQAASLARFDAAKGWPESLEPWQAVALHCRRLGSRWGEYINHPDTREMAERVALAIKSGALAHTTTTTKDCVKPERFVTPPELNLGTWPEQYTRGGVRYGYTEKAVFKDTPHHHITAEAFAAWLAANEIEPSRHAAAWFKAMGVNTDRRPIEPPAGWKAQSPHGLQRIDNTDAGRLVRLADLVRWLMDTKELPCKAAVEAVCSVLEQRSSAAAGWLYLLTEADYAQPLPADHSFFYLPIVSLGEPFPTGESADKGLAGAIKYMRQYWGESSAPGDGNWMGQHVLDPLAIRLHVAHLLWGYGRRVEVAEQTQAAAPAEAVAATPKRSRRDLLAPSIEAAQREAKDPFDACAVFASLTAMAESGKRPLLGVSDDGIKWKDANDEVRFLTIKMVRDRLGRLKKKTR